MSINAHGIFRTDSPLGDYEVKRSPIDGRDTWFFRDGGGELGAVFPTADGENYEAYAVDCTQPSVAISDETLNGDTFEDLEDRVQWIREAVEEAIEAGVEFDRVI